MYDTSDKAAAVREIQRFLVELHYGRFGIPLIRIDGHYGDATRRAVTAFQRIAALPETGEVDYRTWRALYKEYKRYSDERSSSTKVAPDMRLPATLGASGEGVLQLQRMMNTLAERYSLPMRTDQSGIYSYATKKLASAIAELYRMKTDGNVTGAFYDKMLRDYGYPVKEGE